MRGATGRVGAVALAALLAACDRPEVQAARQARATLVALGLPSDGASCGPLDGGVAACEVWLLGRPSVPLQCSPTACRVPDGVELPRAFGDGGR